MTEGIAEKVWSEFSTSMGTWTVEEKIGSVTKLSLHGSGCVIIFFWGFIKK